MPRSAMGKFWVLLGFIAAEVWVCSEVIQLMPTWASVFEPRYLAALARVACGPIVTLLLPVNIRDLVRDAIEWNKARAAARGEDGGAA